MNNTTPAAPEEHYVLRHRKLILFLAMAVCVAGAYAASRMPSAVFPQTDFPRVVVLVDNGAMPSDEMMAIITRPIEEALKETPGTVNIRSATGRGSAEINVFFDWNTDMVQAELYVLGRLSQVRNALPPTAEFAVHRLTFSSFPIVGISLTSPTRDTMDLWERAQYDIKPRLLRTKGVARINILGGKEPEYHVVVDPARLDAHHLSLTQVSDAIAQTNMFTQAGLHEENRQLYLTVVDGRVRSAQELLDIPVSWVDGGPVRVGDFATIEPGPAPAYNVVTAEGTDAVLLNVYSQPNGNTVGIADELEQELKSLKSVLPPDIRLAVFYDQSVFVREGAGSVWESIGFGLLLSVAVLYLFLRSLPATLVAVLAIPVCLLGTIACMQVAGMSFNLMTLGGIAAAIGLIIDDAIVMVEAMHAKLVAGHPATDAVSEVIREVGPALVGSTITPVAVFLPLAFLEGVPGVFFRALAFTMAVSLLISLLIALTVTPALSILLLRRGAGNLEAEMEQGGPVLRRIIGFYESFVRRAIGHSAVAVLCMAAVVAAGLFLYRGLESDFLPHMDEGGFVLDYFSPPGTSLSETDRMLRHVEAILSGTPEIESYSRRTGARLALAIAEPNTGDFLVKLKHDRSKTTDEVVDAIRESVEAAEPALEIEFAGILNDLIGDLTWSPDPVEIKLFGHDLPAIQQAAEEIATIIEAIPGVVDVNSGLVVAGPTANFRLLLNETSRAGMTAAEIGTQLQTALLGAQSSYVLEGDRVVPVRVVTDSALTQTEQQIAALPVQPLAGPRVMLNSLTALEHQPGALEMHREDQRQLLAVAARFSGLDLNSGISQIKEVIAKSVSIPSGVSIEFGGLFQQQQESFANLTRVLGMAVFLVFAVLLLEFKSIAAPVAIVMGSLLALFGVIAALWLTGTTLNIVSFLGAIIGFGIVAKNGILMLDFVAHLQARGHSLVDALVLSGRRRLRPVLMTSLTAFLGLLPLAYGIGAGADMLRPLAIGVIGALCTSLLLSLIATPVVYYLLITLGRRLRPKGSLT